MLAVTARLAARYTKHSGSFINAYCLFKGTTPGTGVSGEGVVNGADEFTVAVRRA